MSEHILIVGAGREIPGLIRDASGPDVATSILCRLDIVAKIRTPERHDRVLALRSDAPAEDWIALAMAVHARHPFTRIAAFGERDQDRAADIAEAIGLDFHSPQTVAYVHDKCAMRTRLADAGVDDTPAAHVADPAELRAFVAEHGAPCVVKPARGSGSFGVHVIRSIEQAEVAFARASRGTDLFPDAGVLVERFHKGPQFSVEAFSDSGAHEILAITRKYSDPDSFVEVGHLIPADLPPQQADSIQAYVVQLLDALGISYGATHTEIVLTDHGPRVIETHARRAGDEIPYMVKDVTGVDIIDCLVRQTLGVPVLEDIRKTLADPSVDRRPEAIWFAVPPVHGVLAATHGLEEAAALPGVVAVRALLEANAHVDGLESSDSRAAFVRARGDDAAEAMARAQEAVAGLEFVVHARSVAGPADRWV